MRKSSKVLSLVLAGAMTFSTAAVTALSVSAAETTTKIYFEYPEELWAEGISDKGISKTAVFAHTWAVAGDSEYVSPSWQVRKEQCTWVEGNIFSYDIDTKLGQSLKEGADYAVIFSTTNGTSNFQTCNLTMGKDCYGDTVVCTGESWESTQDSQKTEYRAIWKNNPAYGPKLEITSTGKVVGEVVPTSTTKEQLVATFLHDFAVKNASLITKEVVANVITNENINVDVQDVYDTYENLFSAEIAAPDEYPMTASLEYIADLLGIVEETTASTEPVESTVETQPSSEEVVPTESTADTQPSTSDTQPSTGDTEPSEDPVPQTQYVVAGSEELCGVLWNGNPNEAADSVMTEVDGVYTKTFTDIQPAEGLQIKIVENTVDGAQNWIGDATGNNITFNVTDVTDVTVTYNPATGEITVSGENVAMVTELKIDGMYAVGNGDGNWLNGVNWNPADESNKMEEVSEKVYQITFEDIEAYENYQVKFAANGAWTDSWGGVYAESGAPFEASYNGDNIVVTVPYALADVTLTLDLTNFDYASKTGAIATITVVEKEIPVRYGDVNNDGKIDVTDVTGIQMYLAKYENAVDAELGAILADVTGDGNVDVNDVTALQKYLAGGYVNTGVAGTEYVAA